jgi:hypothetical protein
LTTALLSHKQTEVAGLELVAPVDKSLSIAPAGLHFFCYVHVHTPNQLPHSKREYLYIESIIVNGESENNPQWFVL